MTTAEQQKKGRRRLEGTVVATKMQKTVTVRIDRTVLNAKYQKRYQVSKTYLAHNENPEVKVGDLVTIEETRPLSARKRWRVVAAK
ncbi:30S ribosomal protein S17 [Candidatus Uhrbacteria bacterium]|nr:30S ribosomal protein S17 [Candidatus Uhrbacteria bacterium]